MRHASLVLLCGLLVADLNGQGFVALHQFTNGSGPGPIQGVDGRLYGTTSDGATDSGTIYAMNPDGTGFTILHTFGIGGDGWAPMDALVQGTDGRLYGTASA
jgi:uncharacterized repeat protein (TIGR03803 family)